MLQVDNPNHKTIAQPDAENFFQLLKIGEMENTPWSSRAQ